MVIKITKEQRKKIKQVCFVIFKYGKKYILFSGTLIGVLFVYTMVKGINLKEEFQIRDAKVRVEAILNGITLTKDGSGTLGNENVSISQWWSNKIILTDMGQFSKASDEFDAWRKQGNIFPYIYEFKIDSGEIVKDSDPLEVIIKGTINGSSFTMRVPNGGKISWE